MTYNDASDGYDEVRALIIEACARAQAEFEAAGDRRRTGTLMQPDRSVAPRYESARLVREPLTPLERCRLFGQRDRGRAAPPPAPVVNWLTPAFGKNAHQHLVHAPTK